MSIPLVQGESQWLTRPIRQVTLYGCSVPEAHRTRSAWASSWSRHLQPTPISGLCSSMAIMKPIMKSIYARSMPMDDAPFKPGELVYVWKRPRFRLAIIVELTNPETGRWKILLDGQYYNYGTGSLHKSDYFQPNDPPSLNDQREAWGSNSPQ